MKLKGRLRQKICLCSGGKIIAVPVLKKGEILNFMFTEKYTDNKDKYFFSINHIAPLKAVSLRWNEFKWIGKKILVRKTKQEINFI